MLLALTPDGRDWTAELLAHTLTETLELARVRAVTLERSSRLGWSLPALLFPAFSLHGEKVLDFKLLGELQTQVPMPYVDDGGS